MGLFSRNDKDVSAPPAPVNLGGPPLYAVIMLSRDDRIRMIGFPPPVHDLVDDIVVTYWEEGVRRRRQLDFGGMELKLKGYPWYAQGDNAVISRRLITRLFSGLGQNGWHVAMSSDLSKRNTDKDSLFFRVGPPMQRVYFAVSFNQRDKIRIIDAPTPQVQDMFIRIVRGSVAGVDREKEKLPGCYELTLVDSPWRTYSREQEETGHLLLLDLLTAFDHMGYELVATVDLCTGTDSGENGDLDTWYFASKFI